MKRVEVRCCCQPRKLLGTLPVGDAELRIGATLMFGRIPLKLERWAHIVEVSPDLLRDAASPSLFEYLRQSRAGGVAFKADGLPIEVLRTIPEFIEAKE